jgi:polygalacturonase
MNEEIEINLNVKHFGAKGDGKTDDTKAIQIALDAGIRLFPAGVYLIKRPLTDDS